MFLDEEGNLRVVKGVLKVISSRHSATMNSNNLCGKDCKVCASYVLEEA